MFVALSPAVAAADPVTPGPLASEALAALPNDVDAALTLAVSLGRHRAVPGDGSTRDQWEALATIAAADLGAVRAVEPHLDAIAILVQAGERDLLARAGTWGVFAAEGGDDPLLASDPSAATGSAPGGAPGFGSASTEGAESDSAPKSDHPFGQVTLTGTKPWCSLAGSLDSALITAASGDGSRGLYSISLRHPGAEVDADAWVARGLTEIPSGPVRLTAVPAIPVGAPGWYLDRPGFAWGGIGVAACWFGGAVGIARTVHAAARARPNPFLLAHLGAIDELLQSSRRALAEAADLIDSPGAAGIDGKVLARRVRGTVARAVEETIDRAGHALGPAPLALDAAHAKRVADLQLYVRQHHAERDQSSLGEALAKGDAPW